MPLAIITCDERYPVYSLCLIDDDSLDYEREDAIEVPQELVDRCKRHNEEDFAIHKLLEPLY